MKKYCILFCLMMVSITLQANVGVPLFGNGTYKSTTALSLQQQFQLNYLQEQLALYAKQVQEEWTQNEQAAILIEKTELYVQQSSAQTQNTMKTRIIEIFKNFGITIFFTSDNLIKQVTTQPFKPGIKMPHHVKEPESTSKQNSLPELHRIHGGRRTLRMITEQGRQRQEAWEKALNLAIDTEKRLENQAKKDLEEEAGAGL